MPDWMPSLIIFCILVLPSLLRWQRHRNLKRMTIEKDIKRILEERDGATSAQILHDLTKRRPGITKATVHPILSRMGKSQRAYRHLGVWYTWPKEARG